jgi:RNA polymerase sigma-70 factor (ECF subfamily)
MEASAQAQTAARPETGAIFRAHASYVLHSLRRLGVRDADVEDVAHEVFLVVHRKLGTYDRARPLKPWLFGIASRVASDYRRLAYVRREVVGDEPKDTEATEPGAEERVDAEKMRARVLLALDEIEDTRRDVFVLHEIDEVTIPEVAHALAIPLNTAYSRLRLARADFKAAMERLRRGAKNEKRGEP